MQDHRITQVKMMALGCLGSEVDPGEAVLERKPLVPVWS
jgi:hypothetical protein